MLDLFGLLSTGPSQPVGTNQEASNDYNQPNLLGDFMQSNDVKPLVSEANTSGEKAQ